MRATRNHHSQYFSNVIVDQLHPSVGRPRKRSVQLADHFADMQPNNINLLGNILDAARVDMATLFHQKFVYGCPLTIWRKGKKKQCVFFVDQYVPSFVWISSNSKAFLFDLCFTTIQRFDYDLEIESNLKHYFILRYFQEELPIVFEGPNASFQCHKFYELFHNYNLYSRLTGQYPSFFSKVLKKSIVQDIKEDIVRSKKASDILKVSEDISWNFKEYNQDVMKYIVSQKDQGKAGLDTLLTHDEINAYYKISSCCDQLKGVYQKYANIKFHNFYEYLKPMMPKQAFLAFLSQQQHQSPQFIGEVAQTTEEMISFYDFSLYILDENNNPAASIGPIDQNLPLSDYFCYSSHNTYLSGNQLTSDCKVDRYLQDLDLGIKCVQLDVHNDGDRPIITHAFKDKFLNKQIDFEETLKAISTFCDENPQHYPILLSIQNHASEANRYRMLNIILKSFGMKLMLMGSDADIQKLYSFRTLKELKGKVIVKTDSKVDEIKQHGNPLTQNRLPQPPAPNNFHLNQNYNGRAPFPSRQFNHNQQYSDRKEQFGNGLQKQLYLPLQEMTKVTVLFKAPKGIQTTNSTAYQCTSLTNEKAAKANQNFIIDYTKRSWLRIYPVGTQINSGNYDISPLLRIGAQIIALNTQTKDENALMQLSYFTAGKQLIPGKIGYVPKPPHLLKGSQIQRDPVVKTITIKVFSNQAIHVKLFGSKQDLKNNANSNLTFIVRDYLEGFLIFQIGETYKDCIPLRFVKQGYRVLVAKNEFFRDSGKRVLIYVKVQDS